MPPVLFDTSFYIAALRSADEAIVNLRRLLQGSPLWLSAVVLEELYAGATTRNRRIIQRLERDFDRARRIVVPSLSDWAQTGQLLARLGATYGYEQIGRARLTNDALLAVSAGRLGITIITANARDFAKLAQFRPFHWQLRDPRLASS